VSDGRISTQSPAAQNTKNQKFVKKQKIKKKYSFFWKPQMKKKDIFCDGLLLRFVQTSDNFGGASDGVGFQVFFRRSRFGHEW
jgi:hypothetical protein